MIGVTADFFRFIYCCIRSEEHTSELQSRSDLVCRLLLEKKKINAFDVLVQPSSLVGVPTTLRAAFTVRVPGGATSIGVCPYAFGHGTNGAVLPADPGAPH